MKLIKIILILFILFGLLTGIALYSAKKLYRGILDNQTALFSENHQRFEDCLSVWNIFLSKNKTFSQVKKFNTLLPSLVGKGQPKTYFVLLQNNMELRATGGFMGSYAKVKFKNGGMGDLIVQDIYVPDGQIQGHVDPPAPIQSAFKQGWFRLRDSNWDPDFPTACQTINWFFEKGGEEKADGTVGINLFLAYDLLKITGPLFLPDYNLTVDTNNFYEVAQQYSEVDFFPGSTQKANIMGALTKTMAEKIKTTGNKEILLIFKAVIKNLNQRQILIYSDNPEEQKFFHALGWDGSLKPLVLSSDKVSDYFYLVESNLGVNKANLFITREIDQEITILEKSLNKRTTILFKYKGNNITLVNPDIWRGDYLNYLRLYLPITAQNIKVWIGDKQITSPEYSLEKKEKLNLIGLGFFVTVPVESEQKVIIDFDLPKTLSPNSNAYSLLVQRQPGILNLPFKLKIMKENSLLFSFDEVLVKDQEIKAKI